MVRTNLQDLLLDFMGNPGIDAVADDVVKATQVGREVVDALAFQTDVVQLELSDKLPGLLKLSRGRINADKSALGEPDSHGDKIAATRAA
jgi:hypothetical protein